MAQSAQEMVNLYIQAEKDVLEGKSTVMNGRQMTMEDLADIRAGRAEWESRLASEAASTKNTNVRSPALANFY